MLTKTARLGIGSALLAGLTWVGPARADVFPFSLSETGAFETLSRVFTGFQWTKPFAVVLCQEGTATCDKNTPVTAYSDAYIESNTGTGAEFDYFSDSERNITFAFLPTTFFAIEGKADNISADCISCTFDGNTFTIPGNANNNKIKSLTGTPIAVDVSLCSDSGTVLCATNSDTLTLTTSATVPPPTNVPEPGTVTLISLGAFALLGYKLKKKLAT